MTHQATHPRARFALALAFALVLAGCNSSTVPTASPVAAVTPSPSPTPTPSPTLSPSPTPSGSASSVPPPSLDACPYVDVETAHESYDDWATTLVDTYYRLPSTYVPPDLVSTSRAGLTGGFVVRSIMITDLAAMTAAARMAGAAIEVESAYRSYGSQQATFSYWVKHSGYKAALLYRARPGHSEHQLGTAIDFKSAHGGSPIGLNWARSPAGAWMMAHAWEYGFVLSYPAGKSGVSCYGYEPWHYRYFGRDIAALIHESGLVTREWLWTRQ